MKISMMVTLYNPTDKNIETIDKYSKYIDRLYLIDNSSFDNSTVFSEFENVIYVPNKENLGIAHALNQAAKLAIKDGFDWLVTMDQDSVLTEQNYLDIKKFIENNNIDLSKAGIISPLHVCNNLSISTNGEDIEEKLDVMTSGNFLNLNIYSKVGDFLDWLFIDMVDTEYCLRLNKLGYKVLRLNNVKMKHNLGNQTIHHFFKKRMICSNYGYVRRYYQIRNNLYINEMYKDVYPNRCKDFISDQKGQIRRVILFEKNKLKKLKFMYKGYKDFKKGIKGKLDV